MSATRSTIGADQHAGESFGRRVVTFVGNPNAAVFILLVVLIVIATISNPSFAEPDQLIRFIARVAPIAIAAVGQYFVIVTGEIDLSMGALVTAQVVISGNLIADDSSRVIPVLLLMVALGVLVGLINGFVTTVLRVPSLIGTLGMMLALSGLIFYWTGGSAGNNPVDSFRQIGRGGIRDIPVLGILPYSVIILAVVLIAASLLVRRPFGKGLVSIGGNPEAARLSGVRVAVGKRVAFVLSSLSATIAGVLLVGFAGVHPSVGQGYEFFAITAVILGGVALTGGRGWVLAAAAGAFALETLFVVLNFLGVPATYRNTVQGVIIIVAVALSQVDWDSRRTRHRRQRDDLSSGIDDPVPATPQ